MQSGERSFHELAGMGTRVQSSVSVFEKTQVTHGQLKPTKIKVEPYSTFAVPFLWMLREQQGKIDSSLAQQLPADEEPLSRLHGYSRMSAKKHCASFFLADWYLRNPSSSFIRNPAIL